MISDEDLKKFKEIYGQQFGVELSRDEALTKAIQLIEFIKSLNINNKNE